MVAAAGVGVLPRADRAKAAAAGAAGRDKADRVWAAAPKARDRARAAGEKAAAARAEWVKHNKSKPCQMIQNKGLHPGYAQPHIPGDFLRAAPIFDLNHKISGLI